MAEQVEAEMVILVAKQLVFEALVDEEVTQHHRSEEVKVHVGLQGE